MSELVESFLQHENLGDGLDDEGAVMTIEAPIALDLDRKAIETFCGKWRITELSLFGSVLRPGEFRDDSDVDVLVTFDDAARWTLFDLVTMGDELKSIVGRNVDLVEKIAVERSPNYIRRRNILENQRTFYVAR
jgi:predicted nucleotidyltransferase